MAIVVVTETARADLEGLVRTHGLPTSTRDRVRASIAPLAMFPLLGRALLGRWAGFHVVLGPWPWMLLVYTYNEAADQVAVVTIQDSRSAQAATTSLGVGASRTTAIAYLGLPTEEERLRAAAEIRAMSGGPYIPPDELDELLDAEPDEVT